MLASWTVARSSSTTCPANSRPPGVGPRTRRGPTPPPVANGSLVHRFDTDDHALVHCPWGRGAVVLVPAGSDELSESTAVGDAESTAHRSRPSSSGRRKRAPGGRRATPSAPKSASRSSSSLASAVASTGARPKARSTTGVRSPAGSPRTDSRISGTYARIAPTPPRWRSPLPLTSTTGRRYRSSTAAGNGSAPAVRSAASKTSTAGTACCRASRPLLASQNHEHTADHPGLRHRARISAHRPALDPPGKRLTIAVPRCEDLVAAGCTC